MTTQILGKLTEEKLRYLTFITYESSIDGKLRYHFQVKSSKCPKHPIKVWRYFNTEEERNIFVEKYKEITLKDFEKQDERKNELKSMTNHAKVGDIVICNWGYEQTNIDFFQITRLTNKGVYYKQIASEFTDRNDGSSMSGYVKPIKDKFLDKPERFAICRSIDDNYSISVGKYTFYTATKVDPDKDHYCSWYA